MTSTTVKPAQRMRRGVIMEHHLGFWPIPLQRGRNRWSRRGCRWNLTGIIALGRTAKASIFESCWIVGGRLNGEPEHLNGQRRQVGRNCATTEDLDSSNGGRRPNRISREPCIIRAEHQARSSFKERNNGYHDNSKC